MLRFTPDSPLLDGSGISLADRRYGTAEGAPHQWTTNGARDEPAPAADPSRRRPRPPSANPRDDPVTTLKLHYDGWLALPAALRRKLGLDKGAVLEVELVDGAIVLRPSGEGRGSAVGRGREATEPPVGLASAAPPSPRADTPATRKGDRARKDPDPSRPIRPRGRSGRAAGRARRRSSRGQRPRLFPSRPRCGSCAARRTGRSSRRVVVLFPCPTAVPCGRRVGRRTGTSRRSAARSGTSRSGRSGRGGDTTGLARPVRAYSCPASGRDRSSRRLRGPPW